MAPAAPLGPVVPAVPVVQEVLVIAVPIVGVEMMLHLFSKVAKKVAAVPVFMVTSVMRPATVHTNFAIMHTRAGVNMCATLT